MQGLLWMLTPLLLAAGTPPYPFSSQQPAPASNAAAIQSSVPKGSHQTAAAAAAPAVPPPAAQQPPGAAVLSWVGSLPPSSWPAPCWPPGSYPAAASARALCWQVSGGKGAGDVTIVSPTLPRLSWSHPCTHTFSCCSAVCGCSWKFWQCWCSLSSPATPPYRRGCGLRTHIHARWYNQPCGAWSPSST
jgi:hypothetical protein